MPFAGMPTWQGHAEHTEPLLCHITSRPAMNQHLCIQATRGDQAVCSPRSMTSVWGVVGRSTQAFEGCCAPVASSLLCASSSLELAHKGPGVILQHRQRLQPRGTYSLQQRGGALMQVHSSSAPSTPRSHLRRYQARSVATGKQPIVPASARRHGGGCNQVGSCHAAACSRCRPVNTAAATHSPHTRCCRSQAAWQHSAAQPGRRVLDLQGRALPADPRRLSALQAAGPGGCSCGRSQQ